MKPDFQHLMSQATRLVRQGQLQDAVAAIQAALGQGMATASPRPEDEAGIIDVQAREVKVARAPRREASGQEGSFLVGSHAERAGTRAYKLYVPPHHHGEPLPLVVMLHGCTQDPDDFAIGTRMNHAAMEQGFYVLYPAQAQNANSSRCWNWFKHNHQQRDRGEPAILAGMTRQVIQEHNIDPRRVYVAGLSAGGAMAAVLGEAYPDIFAAVGVHSGLPVGAATDVTSAFSAMKGGGASRPMSACVPTIVFHGDRDGTVHPVNGERIAEAGQAGSSYQLRREKGFEGRPYTRQVYLDADGVAVIEHWVVHGAGHAWSGGSAQGSHADPQGPSATEAMWRFFASHTLAEATC